MSATSLPGLYAICGSFVGLATITVSLRFYSRVKQAQTFGLDDWTALFGVITFIAACACAIQITLDAGDGYPRAGVDPKDYVKTVVQLSIAFDFLQMNTLACAKWSALFLYWRVFNVDRYRWFTRIVLATAIVVALWYITFDVLSCVQCRRFSEAWTSTASTFKQNCRLNPVWALGLAVSDLILDVWVMIMPIPLIWKLHATTARKVAITGVFLLAFVGLGASVARVVYFFSINAPSRQVIYVSLLECGMTITVVSLPSIWFLLTSTAPEKIARSLRSLRSLGSNDSHSRTSRGKSSAGLDPDEQTANVPPVPSWPSVDLESGSTKATAMRSEGVSRTELTAGSIEVTHEYEVKRS